MQMKQIAGFANVQASQLITTVWIFLIARLAETIITPEIYYRVYLCCMRISLATCVNSIYTREDIVIDFLSCEMTLLVVLTLR